MKVFNKSWLQNVRGELDEKFVDVIVNRFRFWWFSWIFSNCYGKKCYRNEYICWRIWSKVFLKWSNHNRFLGYTKDEDGNLVIEPDEAKTIKRIFLEFLEGSSLRDIAKGLEKDNILTGAGRKKWIPSSVRRILTNEKYMGDVECVVLLQRNKG